MLIISFGMVSKRRRLIGSALVTDEREWGYVIIDKELRDMPLPINIAKKLREDNAQYYRP